MSNFLTIGSKLLGYGIIVVYVILGISIGILLGLSVAMFLSPNLREYNLSASIVIWVASMLGGATGLTSGLYRKLVLEMLLRITFTQSNQPAKSAKEPSTAS